MLRHSALGLLAWSSILSFGSSYIVPRSSSRIALDTLAKRDSDPTDLSWIKKWAAVGDSYTAGIGAGNPLGGFGSSDWSCSRYDQSYPSVLNDKIGPSVKKFLYKACSGARSEGIYKQITDDLEDDLNLVVLSAGGNDLCLVCYDGSSHARFDTRIIMWSTIRQRIGTDRLLVTSQQ